MVPALETAAFGQLIPWSLKKPKHGTHYQHNKYHQALGYYRLQLLCIYHLQDGRKEGEGKAHERTSWHSAPQPRTAHAAFNFLLPVVTL